MYKLYIRANKANIFSTQNVLYKIIGKEIQGNDSYSLKIIMFSLIFSLSFIWAGTIEILLAIECLEPNTMPGI